MLTRSEAPRILEDVPDADAVLGVNIAAGVAYLVLVRRPAAIDPSATTKISPPENADHWSALSAFGDRLVAEARAHAVACVVVADPKKYDQWSYNNARTRIEMATAGALALRSATVEVEVLSQRTAAASLGLKFNKDLESALSSTFLPAGLKVVHWKDRAPALLVALSVAKRLWP